MSQTEFDNALSKFPFPVAFRCRYILTQSEKRNALESILDAYEGILKFLVLVVLSDYLKGEIEDESVDKRLKNWFSAKLSLGNWNEILREILKVYKKHPQNIFMPELLSFYFNKKGQTRAAKKFEEWVKRRNEFLGHKLKLHTDSHLTQTWCEWWDDFKVLIQQLQFLTQYELIIPCFVKRGKVTQARICTGPEQFFIFQDQYDLPVNVKGIELEESLILVDKRDRKRQLMLYPFMVVRAPSDFYLFERGEKQKQNLDRVIYAALGPHQALDIRRRGQEERILRDLERKIHKLGEIGVLIDENTSQPPPYDPFTSVHSLAQKWAEAGYPYYMVEEIKKDLIAQIRHPKGQDLPEGDTLLFLITASLHHGGNWCHFIRQCSNDSQVLNQLFYVFHITYDRPRFRILYGLQYVDRTLLQNTLKQKKASIPDDLQKIINKYVLKDSVHKYLEKIKQHEDPVLARKAAKVLREAKQYCDRDDSNLEKHKRTGLPEL